MNVGGAIIIALVVAALSGAAIVGLLWWIIG